MYTLIKIYWLPITVVVLSVITTLSLLPLDYLPQMTNTDKLRHFIAYALLTLPVAIKKPKNWHLILLAFVLYSGCIELIQGIFHRTGDWLDVAANITGLLFGLLLAQLIIVVMKRYKRNKMENIAE